ncbi:MAG TPA: AMP-binding protein, partial [Alphaproteobacteria bacterium]|nr:AMP-binding protein [Alphaproteobacteria bacterium]
GVAQGDFVLSWMPNGPIAVLNLLALVSLGAVYVPINTSYRGGLLGHVLRNSGARLMIAHGELVHRLADVDPAALDTVVVIGPERPNVSGISLLDQAVLTSDGADSTPPVQPVAPWDTAMIIYTSGTTGPSKGVLSSHRHLIAGARGFRNVGPEDRNLTALPMFHVGGVWGITWAVLYGSSAVVATGFSTREFWPLVRRYGITTTGLLGSMVDFLNGLPPSGDERHHGLQSVIIAPYGPAAIRFAERYGVPVYTEFNMSELSVPLFAGPNPNIVGTCGTPAPGVELRIVDEHDEVVPDGETGELILRMDRPWTISHGYHNDPEATAATWRNGWFHTGDLFRKDAEGHYHFVDRAKDSIRRRGENISSFEVESALLEYPGVAEAAAVGVPAPEGSEQEVMAVIRPAEGKEVDPQALLAFLESRLAHFMVPRYVRIVADLPRTPTQKVQKHRLREEGITSDSWDREAAGISIRRERLETRG